MATVSLFKPSPRRREIAWARDSLAWARLLCLSKRLGENAPSSVFSTILVWLIYFGWFGLFKAWDEWCVCMGLVHGFNMMRWLWSWYEIWRGSWISNDVLDMVLAWGTILYCGFGKDELLLTQHGIWMRDGYKRLIWNWCVWWILRDWLNMYSMWSIHNSLKSLGEISRSCFSGRDVIPWLLLMGVHGGAPSI